MTEVDPHRWLVSRSAVALLSPKALSFHQERKEIPARLLARLIFVFYRYHQHSFPTIAWNHSRKKEKQSVYPP